TNDSVHQAQAAYECGGAMFDGQRYQEAIPHYERALALAQASGANEIDCKSLNELGLISVEFGRFMEAAEYYSRAFAIADMAKLSIMRMKIQYNLAQLAIKQGNTQSALDHCQIANDIAVALNDAEWVASIQFFRGEIHESQRNDAAAARAFEAALAHF